MVVQHFVKRYFYGGVYLQYTDHEMIPARNAKNVVTLAEVMFFTIQRENILPWKK
jgi:hypothetical protein